LDLALTMRGDYAVRAAVSLGNAFKSGGFRKIREVAAEMDLPARYTPQILNLLAKAGIAEARAGQQGGYRLLRPPNQISLLEIVEAAEGPLRPDRCTFSGGPCHWDDMCPLHPIWEEARRGLTDVLTRTTLESVLNVDAALEAKTYPVATDSHRSPRRANTRTPN
jgi:Rrf2 family transcriptional regulator, iron-sulfur cluster assembly transcription factor